MQVWQLTEDNDPNGLLGRPNGYIGGAVAQLPNLTGTCDAATPRVDCGLTIEVWKDAQGALRRGQYIQTVLKGGGLGSEHDFVNGSVLLRISGEVKPSTAQQLNRSTVVSEGRRSKRQPDYNGYHKVRQLNLQEYPPDRPCWPGREQSCDG